MTDTLKKAIKEILNNEKDINKVITKIKVLDTEEEIKTIWYNIVDYKTLEELIREKTDLIFMYDTLKEMDEKDILNSKYFYYEGISAYPVQKVEQDIRDDIESELE